MNSGGIKYSTTVESFQSTQEQQSQNMAAPPPYNPTFVETDPGSPVSFQAYLPSFDYSTVPQSHILTPDQCPHTQPSNVSFVIDSGNKNIKTFDQALDKNSDEVWRFFLTHMVAPKVLFDVIGLYSDI